MCVSRIGSPIPALVWSHPWRVPPGFPVLTPTHPHQGAPVQASKVAEYLFGPRSGAGIRPGTGVGDTVQEKGYWEPRG